MIWQDLVYTLGGVVFSASLLPTVLNPASKIPRKTSVPTALILAVYVPTALSLGLVVSACVTATTAAAWAFIAWRRST